MNKLLFVLLAVLLGISPLRAQKKHPYLFFTDEKITLLKQRIHSDKEIQSAWKEIVKEADKALTENNPVGKADYLSLVYLMTGEKKYAEKTKGILKNACGKDTWDGGELLRRDPPWHAGLGTAHTNFSISIAFDAIYDYLLPDERMQFAKDILRLGIQPSVDDWLSDNKRIHSLNSMGHNWWAGCVYMAGLSSLAVLNEIPEISTTIDQISRSAYEWFGFDGDVLHFKQKNFDNGGVYESVSYANYGLSEYLFFRLACMNTFPDKRSPEIKGLELIPDFFMHVCYPRDGDLLYSLWFGDSNITATGERPSTLLWATGIRNPNMLWLLKQVRAGQHREGLSVNTPLGIVYQPDLNEAPDRPDLPTSAIYEDMGWATMRTSWEKNATLLGVKCGFTWNHAHADASSFILMHKGEQVIKDAGNCWYGSSLYPEYFFQSPAHNVVLFDGKAQPTEQQYHGSPLKGSLHHLMDAGNIKYVLANATGPTSRYFSRNFRHFLWIDNVILVIDDLKTYDYGNFEWLIHPDGTSKKEGGDIQIVNKNASVAVRPLFPETLIESGFDHDFPEKMKLKAIEAPIAKELEKTETYYSVQYPEKVNRMKFVTAIILKDTPADKNLPQITRLKGGDMIGVRISGNGKTTDVFLNLKADGRIMHLNSCNMINTWDTDAYLLAVSYPEGKDGTDPKNISELFVGYGSYVRKGESPIFNSLSKLYVISEGNGSEQAIWMEGQPVMNAEFGFIPQPQQVKLNGERSEFEYRENKLSISVGADHIRPVLK